MTRHTLVARVEANDETLVIRSPAVGIINRVPEVGVYLSALQPFLTLSVLGRKYTMQLPHDVQGWVSERFVEQTCTPVDYDRPLLALSVAAEPVSRPGSHAARAERSADEAEAGLTAVRAPSQGVFYRRANPDSAPYVEEGSVVSEGTVLGLVEVMKCFNQIAYGGPGLPERGTVAKILVEDAAEVEYGQVMFLIRPSS